MHENALLFSLDRQPTAGLLGMEMLAEHLPDFRDVADFQACLARMAQCIGSTGALHRRLYLKFLQEIGGTLDTRAYRRELGEIAEEWDLLQWTLDQAAKDATQLERAGRVLRRLAMREEHFWGSMLNATRNSAPQNSAVPDVLPLDF
jgi:hypothetical protein